MAMLTLSPRSLWLRAKAALLFLLLLASLAWQRACTALAPSAQPVCVAQVVPSPRPNLVAWRDTVSGGPAHLHRKANPRNRWLPDQPAYFRSLPRRPKQAELDAAAAAARRVA